MESLILKMISFTKVLSDEGEEDGEAVSKKTMGAAAKTFIADLETLKTNFLSPTDINNKGKIFSNKIYIG